MLPISPRPAARRTTCALAIAFATAFGVNVSTGAGQSDPSAGATTEARVSAADKAKARAALRLESWRATFPPDRYHYEVDEERHFVYALPLDAEARAIVRTTVETHADAMIALLFDGPPEEPVLIAVADVPEQRKILGGPSNPGRYDHPERRVVVADTGPSLRHELTHALHYGHMERMRLRKGHPLWLQEGLATLFEHVDLGADDALTFLPDSRMRIAWRRARSHALEPVANMTALDAETFMKDARRRYPEARAFCMFLAERGLLAEWYDAFCENFETDPTGLESLTDIFDADAKNIDTSFRDWVVAQGDPGTAPADGDATLGIARTVSALPDGVRIGRLAVGAAIRNAGVRTGEDVLMVDGQVTPTEGELSWVLARLEPGMTVPVHVRRIIRGEVEHRVVEVTLETRGASRGSGGLLGRPTQLRPRPNTRAPRPQRGSRGRGG